MRRLQLSLFVALYALLVVSTAWGQVQVSLSDCSDMSPNDVASCVVQEMGEVLDQPSSLDALVTSDYKKGVMSFEIVQENNSTFPRAQIDGVFTVVEPARLRASLLATGIYNNVSQVNYSVGIAGAGGGSEGIVGNSIFDGVGEVDDHLEFEVNLAPGIYILTGLLGGTPFGQVLTSASIDLGVAVFVEALSGSIIFDDPLFLSDSPLAVADIGGSATDVATITAVCRNLSSGQSVTVPGLAGAPWNCTAAGLGADSGDQVLQIVVGRAACGEEDCSIGGDTTGVVATTTLCRNLSTGQAIRVPVAAGTWSCGGGGFSAANGDVVLQVVVGAVPLEPVEIY
jgi:hypothetical protein